MYRTWLIPYLEGTLDAERRRQFEARLAEDPELRAELASLRRTQPRLRQAALQLRQAEVAAAAPPAPLWPRLRERLDTRQARPLPSGPALWWAGGGLCAAGALVLAVVAGPKMPPLSEEVRTARVSKSTPVIVFRPDNAGGTPVAVNLRKEAARVAAEKQAVQPQIAVRPHPAKPPAMAPPPIAPPLPEDGEVAKRPMPVTPPVRMAKRDPGQTLLDGSEFPPAPTHSPAPLRDDTPLPFRSAANVNGEAKIRTQDRLASPASAPTPARTFSRRAQEGTPHADSPNGDPALPPAPNPRTALGGGGFGGGGTPPANAPSAAPPAPLRAFTGTMAADSSATTPSTLRQKLERTVSQPLYGTEAGAQEQQRLLQDAQQAGTLDALANQLETAPISVSRAAQQELLLGRMRAAVYETAGDLDRALSERRAVALLSTADGEDWFQLAQAEARLGNTVSAQRAYAQALRASGTSLSAAHRAIAHRNLP